MFRIVLMFVMVVCLGVLDVCAQTTEFGYQGSIKDGVNPANGSYDLEFRLFTQLSGGSQVGPLLTRSGVNVAGGIFSVNLDFGSVFPGADRFLEIGVRPAGGGAFTLLTPRQRVASAPYSVKSVSADNASQLGGVPAGQYVQTNDGRLSDARNPLPGSSSYVQNQNLGPQPSSNFIISGSGSAAGTLSAGVVNSVSGYDIGSNRVLSLGVGPENTFAGVSAGAATSGSGANSFFGFNAGLVNTSGGNSFFGKEAGVANTTGHSNSFVGRESGMRNTTGVFNTFMGFFSALFNTTGSSNTFIGQRAGSTNGTGSNNTAIGVSADFATENLNYATAIGSRAEVAQSNSLVLGPIFNVNGCGLLGNGCESAKVGIGTTTPEKTLHVAGAASQEIMIQSTDVGGRKWTLQSSSGGLGGRFEIVDRTAVASRLAILDDGSVGIGTTAPTDRLDVNGTLRVRTLGAATATGLCRTATNQIAACTSSRKYKFDITPFNAGLDVIRSLRPVSFNWISDRSRDLGLVAEDVAKADPLLVTYDAKGEVEGVKYDRVSVVLVNAVKEQQAQLEDKQRQLDELKRQLQLLTDLICSQTKTAADRCNTDPSR